MTRAEMNALRPGDKVIYRVSHTGTKGRIISVWRDSHITVCWENEKSTDTMPIDDENAKHLQLT